MKYKNIKSVAHNLGHSFLSDMNAVSHRGAHHIVPAEIFALAAARQTPLVIIDFLARTVEPGDFLTSTVQESISYYARELFRLCDAQNVEAASIKAATLTLVFDYSRQRIQPHHPHVAVQEFNCRVQIADDRGVLHHAEPKNYWLH